MIDNDDGGTPKVYTYEVDGKEVTATRVDPYGFLYLTQVKGTLPEKYTGAYTSTSEVERAIKEYTNEKQAAKSAT